MNIYTTKSHVARMADKRVLISLDESPTHPSDFCDLVFKKLETKMIYVNDEDEFPSPVVDEKCNDYKDKIREFKIWHSDESYDIYYTTPDRVKKLFKDIWTDEDLQKIEDEEKKMINDYEDGSVFLINIEVWNPDDRGFQVQNEDPGTYTAYGVEEVIATINDIFKDQGPVVTSESLAKMYFSDYIVKV